jgi:hypothetical protein
MKGYNFIGIVFAAIAAFAIQFGWFTLLFVDPYLEGLGKTDIEMQQGAGMWEAFTIQFVGNLIIAFVMDWLLRKLNYNTVSQGIQLALLVWLGFVAGVIGPMFAFQAYSMSFFLINVVGYLFPVLLSGMMLAAWKRY